MTVAELVNRLAGLPPMMEVFVNANGTSMYLNDTEIQDVNSYPPLLRLLCNPRPLEHKKYDSYEEQLAAQKQRAIELTDSMK